MFSWDTNILFGQLEIILSSMKSFEVAYLSIIISNASWVLDVYVACDTYNIRFIEEQEARVLPSRIFLKKKKKRIFLLQNILPF